MRNLTIIMIMLIATLGPSIVIATVGQAALNALGRNPSASHRIWLSMMMAFTFSAALGIIALLVVFNFMFK